MSDFLNKARIKYPDATSIASQKRMVDFNGDGYSDLVVGAHGSEANASAPDKGGIFVFYGSSTGIQATSDSDFPCLAPQCSEIQNPHNEAYGFFGVAVAPAGDVNGDGYADIVVGAPYNQGGGNLDRGAAYVYYGSPTGFAPRPFSNQPYTCNGPFDGCTEVVNPWNSGANIRFGLRVAGAGDVNDDGYGDVLVAAMRNEGAGSAERGAVYIFYGSVNGINPHLANPASPYTCLGPPDCTEIRNPQNEGNGLFGYSISTAGDVDGDGYADIVIGSDNSPNPLAPNNKGAVYVLFGSSSGIGSRLSIEVSTFPCNARSEGCITIQSPANTPLGQFGRSVASAGDINGDGFADLIVGAWSHISAGVPTGAIYVYYGGPNGPIQSALNTIPYDCAGPSSVARCTVLRNPAQESAGHFGAAVIGAGDLNKDGFDDVLVGAPQNQSGPNADSGMAYIFFGGANGLMNKLLTDSAYPCASSSTDRCLAIRNPSGESLGRFGSGILADLDLNGDGFVDFAVTAPFQGASSIRRGNLYAFSGASFEAKLNDQPSGSYPCTNFSFCSSFGHPYASLSDSGNLLGWGLSTTLPLGW